MLQVEFMVGSSKDVSGWGEEMKKMQNHECLFLPEEYSVERQFVCGEGGVCKVTIHSFRSITHTINTCLAIILQDSTGKITSMRMRKFGTCSSSSAKLPASSTRQV